MASSGTVSASAARPVPPAAELIVALANISGFRRPSLLSSSIRTFAVRVAIEISG